MAKRILMAVLKRVQRKLTLKKSKGTELKVAHQREMEKHGKYVAVPGDKTHTRIFVRNGEDAERR